MKTIGTLKWTVAGIALMGLVPATAGAQTGVWDLDVCNGSTLQSCVGFDLVLRTDGFYEFQVEYLSSTASDPGVITAGGIYDPQGAPDFDFYDVSLAYAPIGKSWGAYDDGASSCNHMNGGGSIMFTGCADGDGGSGNGLEVGERVAFQFKSNTTLTAAHFNSGELGARAHVQSFEIDDCSFKPDSRVGIVSPPPGGIDTCGGTVVPEPMSLVLLGTGLLGVGAVTVRRRREDELLG